MALVLGFAVVASTRYTLAVCAGLVIGAALLRVPALGVLVVVAIAAVLGNSGAHVLIGGVPLLELTLVIASLAAVTRVALRATEVRREALIWVVPAIYGLSELLFRNRGNTVSGVREALIFIYPVMFVLPLMSISAEDIRASLLKHGHYICLAGWIVLGIGVYNQATGHTGVTSTGQLRVLGSWYTEPLVASLFMSLWLYQNHRLRLASSLVAAAPIGGLLLANSRSAYLGTIVAVLVLALMRQRARQLDMRGLGRLALLATIVVSSLIVFTPAGQSGVARFSSITSSNDPNVKDRLGRTYSAIPSTTIGWVVGDGVGLEEASITGEAKFGAASDANQTHDSFFTMLHLGGVIGLLVLLLPILLVLVRSIHVRGDPLVQVLVAFSVFTMVMAGFNVVLENSYFGGWMWVTLLLLQAIVWNARSRLATSQP
jgi:O-Antigen ligase